MSEHDMLPQMDADVLAAHEAVIERGQQTFVEVGLALLAIRDGKGYRTVGFATFEDYCTARWDWTSGRYGRNLIRAAEYVQRLQDSGTTVPLPKTEGEARRMMVAERRLMAALAPDQDDDDPPTETEAETSARLLGYVGDPEGRVERSRLRHAYLTGVHELRRDLLQLVVSSVVETLDAGDRLAAERFIRDTRRWLDELEAALTRTTTLRLVGDGDDEARTAP